jgi:hypothetical protein
MRTTLVLPLVGAAVVTAGALFLRIGRAPNGNGTKVIPLPVDRTPVSVHPEPALPDRLRAQGF